MSSIKTTTWKLRPGADRRIRAGHPWIFSNELAASPKGHTPGAAVTLQDASGGFLARGYGNPNSLISFRALSFDAGVEEPTSLEEIVSQSISAWGHRSVLGYKASFRMVYGESDWLPGLVIDRYLVENQGQRYQVLAAQILTYGMEVALKDLEKFFSRLVEESLDSKLSDISWERTSVVIRNDVNIRKLEGLEYQEPQVLKAVEGLSLQNSCILLASPSGADLIPMNCDLLQGQKTGFFLDQAHNIELVAKTLEHATNLATPGEPIRILDLCCYVGQWSTKLAYELKKKGFTVEVTLVDVSQPALDFAETNARRVGATAITKKLDVLEQLGSLPTKHFDVVIADPPAFIKAKKDVPTGRHAYLKMNASAFRLAKRGGLVVSCSCSGLLQEGEFMDTLRKAISRVELQARCLVRGGHASDHPCLMSFPEGFYLKMFLHQIVY